MTCSYRYQPLSSPATQIRLLELLPDRGVIQCRLKVTEIEEAEGIYEPISYCWKAYTRKHWWGSSYKEKKKQREFRLCIDGANFYITENLHGALRQMRFDSKVRVLWADAICINQQDDKEKSAQVAIMARIYKGGFRTLSWLGEGDHRTRKTLKHLKDCADRRWEPMSSSPGPGQSNPDFMSSTSQMPIVGFALRWMPALWDSFCTARLHVSIESIIGRPYFRRAWVVQEIVNSDRVLFMCGKYLISWSDLVDGYDTTNYLAPDVTSFTALHAMRVPRFDYDLVELAEMALSTQASDPRDKLYFLLGLVRGGAMNVDITVNYSKDPGEVFYDFTKRLLLCSTNLAALSMSYGCSPDKPRQVPSWVWNPQPDEPYGRLALPHFTSKQYQAAGGSKSQPEVFGNVLRLRGIGLQTVTFVSSGWDRVSQSTLPFHMDDPREHLRRMPSYFEHRTIGGVSEVSIDSMTAEHRKDLLFRTIWPDAFTNKTPLPAIDEIQEAWIIMKLMHFDSEIVKRFGSYLPGEMKHITLWTRIRLLVVIEMWIIRFTFGDPVAEEFLELWDYFPWRNTRRLARTDAGQLALCPRETSVNDKVVLLQGSGVPFILRPIGNHWQIVGECYVVELMDGSAWDESRCEMLWIE